jgi:hypothetical protein
MGTDGVAGTIRDQAEELFVRRDASPWLLAGVVAALVAILWVVFKVARLVMKVARFVMLISTVVGALLYFRNLLRPAESAAEE